MHPARIATASLAALLLAPGALAAVAGPTLREGASWVERTTQEGREIVVATSRVAAREAIPAAGVSVDTWRVEANLTFAPSPDAAGGTSISSASSATWTRVADGALVRQRIEPTFGEFPAPPVEHVWSPPCTQWRWPVQPGDEWKTSCVATTGGERYSTNESRRALREERVEAPAGAFDAVLVETRDEGGNLTARTWFAPGACAPVRSESFGARDAPPLVTVLVRDSCASARASPAPAAALVVLLGLVAALARRRR